MRGTGPCKRFHQSVQHMFLLHSTGGRQRGLSPLTCYKTITPRALLAMGQRFKYMLMGCKD